MTKWWKEFATDLRGLSGDFKILRGKIDHNRGILFLYLVKVKNQRAGSLSEFISLWEDKLYRVVVINPTSRQMFNWLGKHLFINPEIEAFNSVHKTNLP